MDHPFRAAMFGGFNRQDVLTFLESTAKEAAQQQQQLNEQLTQAQGTLATQETALSQLREQLQQLQQQQGQLQLELEQANVALSTSRSECSQNASLLAAAQQENQRLAVRLEQLEPDALAYAAIKERTAGVELDAHRRAQSVQEQAQQQASHLRRQMQGWMQRVEREYDALRAQVEATVSHAADQMDKAGKCLEQVAVLMGEQEVALEALNQAYEDTDPARVAAPMPIPEQELK